MIIKMKKAALLMFAEDVRGALDELQKLGVMHICCGNAADVSGFSAEKRNGDKNRLAAVEKMIASLEADENDEIPDAFPGGGAALLEEMTQLSERCGELDKRIAKLVKFLNLLSGWGKFDGEMLSSLRERGIYIYLCSGRRKAMNEVREKFPEAAVEELPDNDGGCRFAVVSLQNLRKKELPLAKVPDEGISPLAMQKEYEQLKAEKAGLQNRMNELALYLPELRRYAKELTVQLDFDNALESLEKHGPVAVLQGFLPEEDETLLRKVAANNRWGVLIADPSPDDNVPTLVRMPRWAKIVQPLFSFIGISPGYNELDVSGAVLVFFAIFTAMIVGDAGYGLLLAAGAVILYFVSRHNREGRKAARLLLLLSVCTVVWGVLTANFFGSPAIFGGDSGGVKWLRKNENVQILCFALAAAQLTLGHVWKAVVAGRVRQILGNLGWILILWGNFFVATIMVARPDCTLPEYMYFVYGAGGLLVVFANVNWRSVGDIFNLPFSFINSFVDTLSYIRLYAVGVAGAYIAGSVNDMAGGMASSPWLIGVVVLVLLFGHALNICLSLMSVLVHGVRLNTLEFSNHVGLTWSGIPYKPFRKGGRR